MKWSDSLQSLDESDKDMTFQIIVHEMIHVLGFSSSLMPTLVVFFNDITIDDSSMYLFGFLFYHL